MAFGVGWLEFVVIALVAVMVFGPERLPRFIAQAAQWVRVIRAQANAARDDLMAAADIDPSLTSDLRQSISDLADLHPKRMASSLLSDVTEPFKDAAAGPDGKGPRPAPKTPAEPAAPSYDPDAT
jgi:sec-independent protein translocase protein TatB